MRARTLLISYVWSVVCLCDSAGNMHMCSHIFTRLYTTYWKIENTDFPTPPWRGRGPRYGGVGGGGGRVAWRGEVMAGSGLKGAWHFV